MTLQTFLDNSLGVSTASAVLGTHISLVRLLFSLFLSYLFSFLERQIFVLPKISSKEKIKDFRDNFVMFWIENQ